MDEDTLQEEVEKDGVETVEEDIDNLELFSSWISVVLLNPECECCDWSVGLVTVSRGDVVPPVIMEKDSGWIWIMDILIGLHSRNIVKDKIFTYSR